MKTHKIFSNWKHSKQQDPQACVESKHSISGQSTFHPPAICIRFHRPVIRFHLPAICIRFHRPVSRFHRPVRRFYRPKGSFLLAHSTYRSRPVFSRFHRQGLNSVNSYRVSGQCGDATHVVTVSSHLDVAFVSPTCSPAVLHQPVVLSFFCAVTNNKHGMV